MTGSALCLLAVGKWRYLLTGLALSLLLYTVIRSFSALTAPLSVYRSFSGICTGIRHENGASVITVSFTDRNRLTHSAAFVTRHPSAAAITEQDAVRFVIRSGMFAAGSYPQSASDAEQAGRDILLYTEYRCSLRRVLLRTALLRLLLCLGAAAVCFFAVRICFP